MFSGNSSQASNGAGSANYIEDVFSNYLYDGNATNRSIVNDIDLSTNGGLVWIKSRSVANAHGLVDTARGNTKLLRSNTTGAENTYSDQVTAFNTNGFSLGTNAGAYITNAPDRTYASWTFRKQPKFFDVVTYTGTGSNTTIAHALGSVPGCIIVKRTDTTSDWWVYHRSLTSASYGIQLNLTNAQASITTLWNSTAPTSSVFSLGTNADVNASGGTYVAYLFAHDAGGFGAAGTDNVISCGSVTSSASGPVEVNLGYEPQWILYKQSSATSDWYITDNMRGWTASYQEQLLRPNNSTTESAGGNMRPTATGFSIDPGGAVTWIYIAIRRGPMKTPTDATKVFSPIASSATAGTQLTTNFPVDLQMYGIQAGDAANITTNDRLRGVSTTNTAGGNFIVTSSTAAETGGSYTRNWGNTGFVMPVAIGDTQGVFWNFRRAPGFFDEVCYTGTGSAATINHNLGVIPELMIWKQRDGANDWYVYSSSLGATKALLLNGISASFAVAASAWNNTTPTSSVFSVGTFFNASASTNVMYLFATCPGVSKVGSYTGSGTTKQIDCGFTGGARFVLIKRTDSTGDWYVWDTARGLVSGNDPYLLLNSTAAETTGTDYIDPYSAGFELSSTAPAAINANGGSYIYLAIA